MISKKDELQQFVNKIEIEGRLATEDGNYTVFFNEFKGAEYEFLIQNKEAILELLKGSECVDSGKTYMENKGSESCFTLCSTKIIAQTLIDGEWHSTDRFAMQGPVPEDTKTVRYEVFKGCPNCMGDEYLMEI